MYQFKETKEYAHSYLICRFDNCMIIDPSHDYEAILEKLNGRTLTGILLTHAHMDHIDLIGEFSCPIFMHLEDAHLLFEDQHNGYYPKQHPYKKKNLTIKYLNHLDCIPLADEQIKVYHTPGHTKGSLCFLYDDKLFTGDTLFKESVGRHDLYSGNLVDLRKSILTLLDLSSNIKIYPGHDEPSTIRNETKNNPFYLKWAKQAKR